MLLCYFNSNYFGYVAAMQNKKIRCVHDVSKDNIEILERSRYTISSYRFVFGFPFKLPNCVRCYVVNYVAPHQFVCIAHAEFQLV